MLPMMCMYICTCYMTDKTKTSVLHRCIHVYVHVIRQTRQRDVGNIGCACVYVHVIGLTRKRDVVT